MVEVTISDRLFFEVQQSTATHQPELAVVRSDRVITLEGRFLVYGKDGPSNTANGIFDSFDVKVAVLAGFPEE